MSLLQQRRFPGGTLGRQASTPKDYDNTGGVKRAKSLSKKLTHSTSTSLLSEQTPLGPLVEGLVPPHTPRGRTSKGENVFLDMAHSFMRRSKADASPRTHSAQPKPNPLYISVTDARRGSSIGTAAAMEAMASSSSSAGRSTTEHQLWYSDHAAHRIECTLQGLGLRRVLFDALVTRLRSSHTLWLPDPVELAEAVACGGFWSLEEVDRDGMQVEPKVVEVNRLVREFNGHFGPLGVDIKACNNCLWFVHVA